MIISQKKPNVSAKSFYKAKLDRLAGIIELKDVTLADQARIIKEMNDRLAIYKHTRAITEQDLVRVVNRNISTLRIVWIIPCLITILIEIIKNL